MTALPVRQIHSSLMQSELQHNADRDWRAELQLQFSKQGTRTVLSQRRHVGPLVVQRPFYPEGDVCHIYLIHPPGGVVAGDRLHLQAQITVDSHALITTPAATKFYRAAPGRTALLEQCLTINKGTLEWLPQESIFFNETSVHMRTRVELDAESKFIGWELACYGRRAGDEPFVQGRIHQGLELWREGKPLLLDHLRVSGGHMMQRAKWGLSQRSALGSLLAYPSTAADVDAVRALAVELATQASLSCTLVDGVLLCRALCEDGAMLKQVMFAVWSCLRPRLLQRSVLPPRIWAT